ncbi:MAG: VanZ family protein [Polaribacter sp.]
MKSYLPAIGWSVIILLLSTRATINLPQSWGDLYSPDKFGHAFVYAVLCWLLLKAFQKEKVRNAALLAVIISGSYGILMEVVQYSFFPNRFFEKYDIIANISGSLIGLWLGTKKKS